MAILKRTHIERILYTRFYLQEEEEEEASAYQSTTSHRFFSHSHTSCEDQIPKNSQNLKFKFFENFKIL